MPAEGLRIVDLEAIEAGEALHFDELGLIAAMAVFADAEVEGQEMRVGVFVRHAVAGGDGAFGPFVRKRGSRMRSTRCSQISVSLAAKFGDEDRCFGDAEFDGAGVAAVEVGQEFGVVLAG
jgi:hypothetical protein